MNSKTFKWALAAAVVTATPMHAVMANSQTPNDQRPATTSEHDHAQAMASEHADDRNGMNDDGHAADNTARNKRDRNDATTLPTDQPNNQADIDTAAAVRAAIVEDDSLSISAHNIKLVAANGKVVLRGPVNNIAEKNKVADIASRVNGVTSVENLIEIDAD